MDAITVAVLAAIGFAGGAAGGVFGLGGGLLMVPGILFVLPESFLVAKATALLVSCASTPFALHAHRRAGNIDVRGGALMGASGVGGSVAAVYVAQWVPEPFLRIAFAMTMLMAASRLVQPRIDGASRAHRSIPLLVLIGAAAGLTAGFLGIGGGLVMVPALVLLGTSMHVAVGTSLLAVLVNSIAATGSHLSLGYGPVIFALAAPMAVGAIAGAFVGSRAAIRLTGHRLRIAFAIAVSIVGVAMVKAVLLP